MDIDLEAVARDAQRCVLCVIDPHTYTSDELEFLAAMRQYKVSHRRPFPSWREVLAVVQSLGYKKEAAKVPGGRAGGSTDNRRNR